VEAETEILNNGFREIPSIPTLKQKLSEFLGVIHPYPVAWGATWSSATAMPLAKRGIAPRQQGKEEFCASSARIYILAARIPVGAGDVGFQHAVSLLLRC
jgi:hypothetical protein